MTITDERDTVMQKTAERAAGSLDAGLPGASEGVER